MNRNFIVKILKRLDQLHSFYARFENILSVSI